MKLPPLTATQSLARPAAGVSPGRQAHRGVTRVTPTVTVSLDPYRQCMASELRKVNLGAVAERCRDAATRGAWMQCALNAPGVNNNELNRMYIEAADEGCRTYAEIPFSPPSAIP